MLTKNAPKKMLPQKNAPRQNALHQNAPQKNALQSYPHQPNLIDAPDLPTLVTKFTYPCQRIYLPLSTCNMF